MERTLIAAILSGRVQAQHINQATDAVASLPAGSTPVAISQALQAAPAQLAPADADDVAREIIAHHATRTAARQGVLIEDPNDPVLRTAAAQQAFASQASLAVLGQRGSRAQTIGWAALAAAILIGLLAWWGMSGHTSRIDEVALAVQDGDNAVRADLSTAIDKIGQRFDQNENRITAAEDTLKNASAAFTALSGRVNDNEAAIGSLDGRLGAVETGVGELRGSQAALAKENKRLNKRLATQERQRADLAAAVARGEQAALRSCVNGGTSDAECRESLGLAPRKPGDPELTPPAAPVAAGEDELVIEGDALDIQVRPRVATR